MAYIDNVYAVVNIAPTGVETYVRLSQNENGRTLNFAIVGATIPSGSSVTITGTKPDGNVYSKIGSLSSNTAVFDEDVQLTAVAGSWIAKIEVVNAGNLIATGRIRFVIDADPAAEGIESDSQLEGYVAQMMSIADQVRGEAYGSPLTASTVAGMTDHTRVYVYTGSESGYTNGNWYYWNGSAWTSGGVYNAVAVDTDTSLTIAGKAADAKATGDRFTAAETEIDTNTGDIADLRSDLEHIGLSDSIKVALLSCFEHVAWIDEHGQTYYDTLEAALYADEYPRITAVFTPGSHTVYTDDALSTLTPYLTVKYFTDASDPGTTVSSNQYTLSGTLTEGQNVVRVSYSDLTTTFTLVAVDFYNIHEWSMSNGLLQSHVGTVQTNATYGMVIAEGATDRRTVGASRGVKPYWGTVTADWLDIYPVPIPLTAKKCTLTITPSKSLISRGYRVFDGSKYGSAISWVTYTQGPIVIDLPEMSEQYYLQIVTQYESGSSSYPEEIQEFTIEFSDVA